jgi:O-antigen ligase
MAKTNLQNSSSPVKTILYGSSLVTLAFWTNFSDPFNPLKLILILAIGFWLAGYLIIDYKSLINNTENRFFYILVSIFVLALLIATLNSEVKQIALLGEYQRNNGFLFYFSLSVILVSTCHYFKTIDLEKLSNVSFFLGFLIAIYGLIQINGLDFVNWINPYNSIISTVGNPNFAGAIFATLAVLIFGFAILNLRNKRKVFLNIILFVMLSTLIYLSDARQGLLGLLIGCLFIIGILVHSTSQIVGRMLFIGFSFGGFFAILGILQIGPLANLLYKGSVSVRGYYWRAGIEMFKDHPWFGVGIDNYGNYFKQYREVNYPLNYGFDLTSSNAHNVFIQMYSTAGLFAGTAYLLLVLYVLWRGLNGLRKTDLNKRVSLATVYSAWLTLQAISVVSIDSAGVTIWSWVLAGAIIAMTSFRSKAETRLQAESSLAVRTQSAVIQTLISSFLIIPVIALSINIFKVESTVQNARKIYNPKAVENGKYLQTLVPTVVNNSVINTIQITELASFLATSGYANEGIELLKISITKNPRNLDALNLLASYYSELKKPELAIELRLRIAELDQYNAKNYYKLGLDYKSIGNFADMEKMKSLVLSFASETPEGVMAKTDLVS